MTPRNAFKLGIALAVTFTLVGCGSTRDFIRSKDFRDQSPAARQTGTPSPVANVPDMPGWTTDVDAAIAFATENPQKTVLFVQRSGDPETEAIKTILNSADAEKALADKQKVTLNTATAADLVARFGVSKTPAVVMLGPGGIAESQKNGKISKSELLKYLK
jgi:hypothetical protein